MNPSSNAGDELDEILAELFDRGERLGASKWVSNDEKAHAVSEAKAAIQAWSAQQVREARIEELRRHVTLNIELASSADYKRGFHDALDQLDVISERRVAALQAIANQGVLPNREEKKKDGA